MKDESIALKNERLRGVVWSPRCAVMTEPVIAMTLDFIGELDCYLFS